MPKIITITPLAVILLAAGLDLTGCARRAALYGFEDSGHPARQCETDSECALIFGGDGGPAPADWPDDDAEEMARRLDVVEGAQR